MFNQISKKSNLKTHKNSSLYHCIICDPVIKTSYMLLKEKSMEWHIDSKLHMQYYIILLSFFWVENNLMLLFADFAVYFKNWCNIFEVLTKHLISFKNILVPSPV